MEPNWMLARTKCASVGENWSRVGSLHSQVSESDTWGVLSDKARLLWRLRGICSLDCACLCDLCCTVLYCVHISEVPTRAVRISPSYRYRGQP